MPRSRATNSAPRGKPRTPSPTRRHGRVPPAAPVQDTATDAQGPASETGQLLLPALKAHMGDWAYYIVSMRLRDIAERVHIASEVHRSEQLRELLQRALRESRANEIRDYLLDQPQRLLNTMVV